MNLVTTSFYILLGNSRNYCGHCHAHDSRNSCQSGRKSCFDGGICVTKTLHRDGVRLDKELSSFREVEIN